jgi:four helix bundle protein
MLDSLDVGLWTLDIKIFFPHSKFKILNSFQSPISKGSKAYLSNIQHTMQHNFRELQVWQEGMKITAFTYFATKQFPKEEIFGLTSQMRRAAVSIPSNISEGCGRGTDLQLIHFLDISLGSACELETQVLIALDLCYLEREATENWLAQLHSLQKRLRSFRNKLFLESGR